MIDHSARTINAYNVIASAYEQKTFQYPPLEEREKFASLVKPKGKILDAGCGPGRDSAYFLSKGFDVLGVDLSDEFIKIAKKRAPKANFLKQDLRKLHFLQNSFDGIWACASLLHLKRSELPLALQNFHSILRPGGILFILVKEGVTQGYRSGGVLKELRRYFTYFQENEMRDLLRDAGFSTEKIETWNQKDRWPERPREIWLSVFSTKT